MQIESSGELCEVYAVHISFENYLTKEQQVTFYYTTKSTFGLGVDDLREALIVDNQIGNDFNLHIDEEMRGVTILWNHFENVEHLAQLIELDPTRVKAFEAARTVREKNRE